MMMMTMVVMMMIDHQDKYVEQHIEISISSPFPPLVILTSALFVLISMSFLSSSFCPQIIVIFSPNHLHFILKIIFILSSNHPHFLLKISRLLALAWFPVLCRCLCNFVFFCLCVFLSLSLCARSSSFPPQDQLALAWFPVKSWSDSICARIPPPPPGYSNSNWAISLVNCNDMGERDRHPNVNIYPELAGGLFLTFWFRTNICFQTFSFLVFVVLTLAQCACIFFFVQIL